jgi:Mn2+/Fe2+ NRAMP family transporter
MFAPGILVAATGVGAGDLITAGLGGASAGMVILWAAGVGAVLKWFLNEGLARWQMATGTTLLEGWTQHLGRPIRWVFLIYLVPWAVFTAGALASACGAAGTGLLAIGDPATSKVVWGVAHALAGLLIVRAGGFGVFERVMSVCTGVMFVTVIATAVLVGPAWGEVWRGLTLPVTSFHEARAVVDSQTKWVVGLLGGVGGTVTLMSYSYWIREQNRGGRVGLRTCRIDLALAYTLTGLFGMAMVIIGSRMEASGSGASVALQLADQIGIAVGPAGRWAFLLGFWSAVFTSLLGVWQSVPYLFADFVALGRGGADASVPVVEATPRDLAATRAYRLALVALPLASIPLLFISLQRVQLAYAIVGSMFMPLLALTLLILNNRTRLVGRSFRNGVVTNVVLMATLAAFAWMGWQEAVENVRKLMPAE